MTTDPKALLKRAQNGDEDAFEELFEELRATAFAVALRTVGANDAEDVVMEAFLKAWQTLPRFKGRSSLKTWLHRITYNCCVDTLRKRQRRREDQFTEDEDGRSILDKTPDPSQENAREVVSRREIVKEVGDALEELKGAHRIVLQLRYKDGMSYTEIAAATGASIGTVMSRLFYGKQQLQKVLSGPSQESQFRSQESE